MMTEDQSKPIQYLQISSKLVLQKKKKAILKQRDGDEMMSQNAMKPPTQASNFIVIAARNFA
jgi:hypothetical protein